MFIDTTIAVDKKKIDVPITMPAAIALVLIIPVLSNKRIKKDGVSSKGGFRTRVRRDKLASSLKNSTSFDICTYIIALNGGNQGIWEEHLERDKM